MGQDRPRTRLNGDQLDSLGALGDQTRRRLYEHVVACGRPVTRDQVSSALGVERSLVAYHLDRLVDQGLLDATFARPPGRGGPGAGRPSKHYARSEREFSVNLPPREYGLLAELLARAVAADDSGAVGRALAAAAEERGRALAEERTTEPDGSGVEVLLRRLVGLGYEPYDDNGVIRLRNCPFHRLAREHTELVCGLNLNLLGALVAGLGLDVAARLDPAPDRCCVTFAAPD